MAFIDIWNFIVISISIYGFDEQSQHYAWWGVNFHELFFIIKPLYSCNFKIM